MKNIFITIMMFIMLGAIFTSFEYRDKYKEAMLDHIESLKDHQKTNKKYDKLIDDHILLQIEHIKALKLLNELIEDVEGNQNNMII